VRMSPPPPWYCIKLISPECTLHTDRAAVAKSSAQNCTSRTAASSGSRRSAKSRNAPLLSCDWRGVICQKMNRSHAHDSIKKHSQEHRASNGATTLHSRSRRREKINRSHLHTHRQRTTPPTPTHTHDQNNTPNPQTNTSHKHSTTVEGGATTVRTTSHARMGGRAEVECTRYGHTQASPYSVESTGGVSQNLSPG